MEFLYLRNVRILFLCVDNNKLYSLREFYMYSIAHSCTIHTIRTIQLMDDYSLGLNIFIRLSLLLLEHPFQNIGSTREIIITSGRNIFRDLLFEIKIKNNLIYNISY